MINKKAASGFFIFNLVVAIFAVAFVFGSGVVSSADGGLHALDDTFHDRDLTYSEQLAKAFTGSINSKISKVPTPTKSSLLDKNKEKVGNWLSQNTGSPTKERFGQVAGYAGLGGIVGEVVKSLGGDAPWAAALGNGIQAGTAAASVATLFAGEGGNFLGASAGVWGLGVGIAVFILTYKEVEYETVFFTCQPWEAPIGGNDCEKCNDALEPCSEYRCKSLGQACEIVNPGTENELCVWVNPKDVNSPSIRPLEGELTEGYQYVPFGARPPNWGMNIKPLDADCIPPYTPFKFGIETDKPAQCKVDFLIKEGAGQAAGEGSSETRGIEPLGYDDMEYFFGNDNLYDYNHSQLLNLPSPDTVNRIGELNVNEFGEIEIRNDGNYNLYVRCRSANGFYNADPYLINFCIEPGPDLKPPVIEEISIRDGQPVNFEVDEVPISIFTNEPANCKWERDSDLAFKDMSNEMVCANNLQDIRDNMLYECRTTLTGIEDREINQFYFRCEDQPHEEASLRNKMSQGKSFTLVGTQPLNIKEGSVIPETGTIVSGATSTISVELGVETQNGYQEGVASCLFSTNNSTYIKFKDSDSYIHRQNQDLVGGTHTYYYQCIDLGGNMAQTSTTFEVFVDKEEPRVVRVLKEGNALKIITDEDAVCRYSNDVNVKCNFQISDDEGTNPFQYASSDNQRSHLADWKVDEPYYIKCADESGKEPNPTACSIIVQPVELGE